MSEEAREPIEELPAEKPSIEEQEQPQVQFVAMKTMYQAVIVISLAMSILSTVIYDRFFTTKIATYDLPGLLRKIQIAETAKQITPEQSKAMLDAVKNIVESVPSNYVVISGDAILGKPAKVKELQLSSSR